MPEHVTPERKAHPVLFLILFFPMGIPNGYVIVTLEYLLHQNGVGVGALAGLVALFYVPQTWKFLWAPLVDTTLTLKRWYVISAIATGGAMIATSVVSPTGGHLLLLEVLVVLFSTASTFNMMAADSLMAHATLPEEKGQAGGWSQAGNLGGTGLGGGAGLWLAQHVPQLWVSGAALGALCIAASVVMLWLKEPRAAHRVERYFTSLANVGRECLDLLRSRLGFLALFIMLLPIGTGAAQNLWAAVAGDWHASADTVALVNGVLGGVISIPGCVLGGLLCDRMDRKTAYCVFGVAIAAMAVAMAIAPRTEIMFIVFTSIYAFGLGFCYAAFGAVVLEAIGAGAAATKYNLLAGIANAPIAYQTMIDGWGQVRWGSGGMLYVEALCGVVAVALYLAVALMTRGRFRQETPAYEA